MSEQPLRDNACARAEQQLPNYWQHDLAPGDRAWLEEHLQICAECADLSALWRELGQLPEAEPDPSQRQRFDAMVAAHGAVTSLLPWYQGWRMWLRPLPVGLALALLLAGLGGGWWLRYTDSLAKGQTEEIAALREEVHATNQLMVLSMLQQQSANDRLAGVSYSNRLRPTDPQITQALLHSLQYDPSPNVRLAALDALQRSDGDTKTAPATARGLVEAFQYQTSPLVQVALVDSFLELRPLEARDLLQKVSTDPAYSSEVRQRAAWGLSHWN